MGTRFLHNALASYASPESPLQVRLKRWPFFLNANMPKEAQGTREERISRGDLDPSPQRSEAEQKEAVRRRDELNDLGIQCGIRFNWTDLNQSDTMNSHRLILFAERYGRGEEVSLVLARQYFEEGRRLNDADTLLEAAAEAGLERQAVVDYLSHPDMPGLAEAADSHNHFLQQGLADIPLFVFSSPGAETKYLQGSQSSAEPFLEALRYFASLPPVAAASDGDDQA